MKKSLIIIGCILVAVGVFVTFLSFRFPIEQTYSVGGGELTGLVPNFTFIYLGVGIVIVGGLLAVIGFLKG